MRKPSILPVFVLLAILSGIFAFTGTASAATVPHKSVIFAHTASTSHTRAYSVHPYTWSGGGCGSWGTFGPWYAQATYKSCISGDIFGANSDAYITIQGQDSSKWVYCSLTISIRDDTTRNTITSKDTGCLWDAQNNSYEAHYVGNSSFTSSGHKYHTYVSWRAMYNGVGITGGTMNSPELSN